MTTDNDTKNKETAPRSTRKKDPAPRGVFLHGSSTPKKRVWAIRFTCGQGHIHEQKVGTIKSDAKLAHDEKRLRVRDEPGWCPRLEDQQKRARVQTEQERVITFGQYGETWWSTTISPHRKPRTTDYYRRIIDLHLTPAFGSAPLNTLTAAKVRAVVAEKLSGQSPLAKNTVKNIVATLRAILYQAQEDGLITNNPAARLGKLFSLRHDPRQHVTVLEPGDVNRVITAAMKWYPDHELGIRLLFYTGMREGELLGLQWDDIDWQRNLIDLRRTVAFRKGRLIVNTPKSGKLRTIDIAASLTARLKERWSIRKAEAALAGTPMSPWVFPALTDPTHPRRSSHLR
jgi:integrase